ncbi:MAG: response regulator transcription factor [bacterium]|nr:response regulator transcription factor [bacterium]
MKILIVEDERHIADGLKFNLEAEGFEITAVETGEEGLANLEGHKAVVLDVMLPGMSGFDVARQMREAENYTPILMLTALGRPEDVVHGFEAGADDYLPKPFQLDVFLARLKALLRRSGWQREKPTGDTVDVNGRTVDLANLELRTPTETIHLTLMECNLLKYLIDNEGRAVSRKEILEDVWGLQEDTDTRAIDNFIVRLRRHLEDEPNNPQILKTVRGVGYRFARG